MKYAMLRLRNRLLLATLAFLGFASCGTLRVERLRADVCVYGATSAGVIAAIQACQQGQTVLLLDCDGWVGSTDTVRLRGCSSGGCAAVRGPTSWLRSLVRQ